MATTTSFTSLAVPAPDDTMDMSSPANRPLDDDIDIDFGDYSGGVPLPDEQMIEDTTRPTTATDEMMDDDAQFAGDAPAVQDEEVMRDEPTEPHDAVIPEDDEELIDYGEDEDFHEQIVDDTEIVNLPDEPTVIAEAQDDAAVADEEAERPTEEADLHAQAPLLNEEVAAEAEQISEQPVPSLGSEALEFSEAAEVGHDGTATNVEEAHEETYENFEEQAAAYEEEQEAAREQRFSINTTLDAAADGPDTPTDTGLHPMTVRYGDLQIPLFKSRRQLDGLLRDDNLANLSLADLIRSCRQRLAYKIGEISNDQELVLSFDHLGLMTVEDSRAAFAISLNEVLEVYLQLHHNDGVQEVAPLSLILTTQLKFASSFSLLKQAAEGGQGMSAFGFLQPAGEETDQHYFQEGEDWAGQAEQTETEHADDQEYDESTYVEHEQGTADFAGEQYEQPPSTEEEHEETNQDYYYHETAEGDYHPEDQGEAADALDGLTGNTADNFDDAEDNTTSTSGKKGTLETAAQDTSPDEHLASTASSTTVQGDKDTAQSTTGEYIQEGEDLIDWDEEDENLTTNASEHTNTGQEGDLTASTKYHDTEAAKAADDRHQILASEDFLNEFPEHQDDPEQGYDDESFLDYEGLEGKHQGQADDNLASQHEYQEEHDEGEDYYPDYQAEEREDDEQFHTAHEGLFEGQDYEHGLEHTDFQEGTGEQQEGEEEEFDDTVLIHRPDEEDEQDRDEHPEDLIDDIGYDDEDEDDADDHKQQFENAEPTGDAATATEISAGGNSPHAKRSFDEIDDLDDESFEMPEIKKVRSS